MGKYTRGKKADVKIVRVCDHLIIKGEKPLFGRFLAGISGAMLIAVSFYGLFLQIGYVSLQAYRGYGLLFLIGSLLVKEGLTKANFCLTRYKTYGVGILIIAAGVFSHLGLQKSGESPTGFGTILLATVLFLFIYGLYLAAIYFNIVGIRFFLANSLSTIKRYWKEHLISLGIFTAVLLIIPFFLWLFEGVTFKRGFSVVIILDLIFIWCIYAGDAFEERLTGATERKK